MPPLYYLPSTVGDSITGGHVRIYELSWSLLWSLCLSVPHSVCPKVPNIWLLNERENILVSSV